MAEALCGLELILRGVAERHRAAYVVEPLFVVAIEGSSPGPKPAPCPPFTQYRADDHRG